MTANTRIVKSNVSKGLRSKRLTLLSISAVQQLFYISICISTLPTQQPIRGGLQVHLRSVPRRQTYAYDDKSVYPYDYMDGCEMFARKKLPLKEVFYSILEDEHISDEVYEHAQDVWKTFKLEHMSAYHDLYLKSGVLLLADVFENFARTAWKTTSRNNATTSRFRGCPGMLC